MARLDIQAIADRIKEVLDQSLVGVNVYANPPADGNIDYDAIGIVPSTGPEGGFVEYQCTFGNEAWTKTYWVLEVLVANPEAEDRRVTILGMLGIGTPNSIFDALADFNDDTYTGAILTATAPAPVDGPNAEPLLVSRIPITVNKRRTAS